MPAALVAMTAAATVLWDQPGAQMRSGMTPTWLRQSSTTPSPSTMSARMTSSGAASAHVISSFSAPYAEPEPSSSTIQAFSFSS